MRNKIKLSEIKQHIDFDYIGTDVVIERLNLCDRKSNYQSILSYVSSEKYLKPFSENKSIKALILTKELFPAYNKIKNCSFIIDKNPEEIFYKIHELLVEKTNFYELFSQNDILTKDFHSSVIIEDGVKIGKNVKIGYNSVIKTGTIIKDNVTIGDNVVIGSEGFQIIRSEGVPKYIKHTGGVLIEDNVFIGAGTTISKSLFEGHVIIGKDAKIDSQVHIGHNSSIGERTVITGNTLLMGSVQIGNDVWVAPSSTIGNKVIVSDDSFVGSMSLVNKNILKSQKVMGIPARKFQDYMKLIKEQNKTIILKK